MTLLARRVEPGSEASAEAPRWWRRLRRLDVLLVVLLAVAAATASLLASRAVPHELIVLRDANDTWFEADTPRVAESMAHNPGKFGARYLLHPLFSELTYPFAFVLRGGLGMEFEAAVRVMVAVTAALWVAGIFALLRLAGLRTVDAVLLTFLGSVTASAMCWLILPETHAMGSVSILAAMLLVAIVQQRRRAGIGREPVGWHVAISILTLGFTVSNWMAGLAATWVARRRRWAEIILVAGTIALAAALVEPVLRKGLQRVASLTTGTTQMIAVLLIVLGIAALLVVRKTGVFQRPWARLRRQLNRPAVAWVMLGLGGLVLAAALLGDRRFIANEYAGSPLRSTGSFVYHTVALPQLQTFDRYGRGWPTIYTQHSLPGSAGPWGVAAVGVWSVLLLLGAAAAWRRWGASPLVRAAGMVLAGQFTLHLFYGEEVFLYSMNWTPLLILLVALPLLEDRFRLAVRGLVAVLILCLIMNNIPQVRQAIEHVARLPVSG